MSIISTVRLLLMPLILWKAKRRSKRDNKFTLAELQQFSELLTKNKSK